MIEFSRKIGQNRGKPRLWIEGKHLVDAGLDHGATWDLVQAESGLFIARAYGLEGTRKIAGKPGRPIIDISGPRSLGAVSGAQTVKLTYKPGSGCIKVEMES